MSIDIHRIKTIDVYLIDSRSIFYSISNVKIFELSKRISNCVMIKKNHHNLPLLRSLTSHWSTLSSNNLVRYKKMKECYHDLIEITLTSAEFKTSKTSSSTFIHKNYYKLLHVNI